MNNGYGDFGRFGNAAIAAHGAEALTTVGGAEDGYAGLSGGLQYAFRPGAAVYLILISDEDRDIVEDLSFADMQEALGAD